MIRSLPSLRQFRRGLLAAAVLGAAALLHAQSPEEVAASRLSKRDSVVLGVVEGFTELLPISSTGHLIVTQHLLGLDRPPAAPDTSPEEAPIDTFIVIIQLGAFVAIIVAYRARWWSMLGGAIGRDRAGLLLLRNVALALVPVVILGLTIEGWISRHLFSIRTVAIAAGVGALVMIVAQFRHRKGSSLVSGRSLDSLRIREAVLIGVYQCFSLWPGMSRSMTTIVGGYFVGLTAEAAAEFSFLLGAPTLAGAALLKGIKHGGAMVQGLGWTPILLGTATAAVAAGLSIRVLLRVLSRRGLIPFACYRGALAAALLILPF